MYCVEFNIKERNGKQYLLDFMLKQPLELVDYMYFLFIVYFKNL